MIKKSFISIILLIIIQIFSASYGYAKTVSIGIIPFYSPEKIWALYQPLIEYLNKTTDIKWELKLFKEHEALVKGICANEVSIAFLGPVPLGRAYEACGVDVLLVALGKDGKSHYRSIIFTADPKIKSLKDLNGKPFPFVKGSTAAHILPAKMLTEEGIEFKPVFYKSQEKIVQAVLNQEVLAGGVKELIYEKFKSFNLKVLKASEPIPNHAFCASPAIDKKVAEKFKRALLKLKPITNEKDKELVKDWDDEIKNGFILPYDGYLKEVLRLQKWDKKFRDLGN